MSRPGAATDVDTVEVELTVSASDTIAIVKAILQDKVGIPATKQLLVHSGGMFGAGRNARRNARARELGTGLILLDIKPWLSPAVS